MFNYQGLLNPSQFPQQQMAPQGASYWLQYAQRPSPLSLPIPLSQNGAGGGSGTPTGPTPPVTPPVLPPGTPPRPPGPAGGGDRGWGGQQNQGGGMWGRPMTPMQRQVYAQQTPITRAMYARFMGGGS